MSLSSQVITHLKASGVPAEHTGVVLAKLKNHCGDQGWRLIETLPLSKDSRDWLINRLLNDLLNGITFTETLACIVMTASSKTTKTSVRQTHKTPTTLPSNVVSLFK